MQAAVLAVVGWKALVAGMAWVLGRMLGWQPGLAAWGGYHKRSLH